MRKYQENIAIGPTLLLGGAIAACFLWDSFKEAVGAKTAGRTFAALPGIGIAAVLETMAKPKVSLEHKKYIDYASLAALVYSGYSVVTYEPTEEEEEKEVTVTTGQLFKVALQKPESSFTGESFRFTVQNTYSTPLEFWIRVQARPGHDKKSLAAPEYEEIEGPYTLQPGESLSEYTTRGIAGPIAPAPPISELMKSYKNWQYRIQLATGKEFKPIQIYVETDLYNYHSVY